MTPTWQAIYDDFLPFLRRHNLTMTDFCRLTGRSLTSLSTLTRPLNDPKHKQNPSIGTIHWIYEGMGVAVPQDLLTGRRNGRNTPPPQMPPRPEPSRPEPAEPVEIRVAPAATERVIRLEIRIPPEGEIVVHRLP